jgi:hypothetical protein
MTPTPTLEEIKIGLAITGLMIISCLYGIHLGATWEAKRHKKAA